MKADGNATLRGKSVTLDVVKVDNGGSQNATDTRISTGGGVSIAAKNDVNVIGSAVDAGTSLDVKSANGSVNVVSADVTRKTDDGHSTITRTTQQGSQLSSGTSATITKSQAGYPAVRLVDRRKGRCSLWPRQRRRR